MDVVVRVFQVHARVPLNYSSIHRISALFADLLGGERLSARTYRLYGEESVSMMTFFPISTAGFAASSMVGPVMYAGWPIRRRTLLTASRLSDQWSLRRSCRARV